MDNNFSALLLSDAGLSSGPAGLEIKVRLPWYRALPLSVVEVASLAIDGKAVPADGLRLEINGKSFRLNELPEQIGEFWFVLDAAVVRIPDRQVGVGELHTVDLQLNLYPPYIPHLTWVTQASKSVRVDASQGGRP